MTQLIQLPHYGVISVSGEDQKTYLQGQLTCDLNQLDEKEWLAGCLCDAKGKLWSNFWLAPKGDELCLVMRRSVLPVALAALKKFAVFSKVEINDASDRVQVYGANESIEPPEFNALITFSQDRSLILSEQQLESSSDHELWQFKQITEGYPELEATSMTESHPPQALNQAELNAISFSKGCYLGQEGVARMKYLGKQKRASFYLTGKAENILAGDELVVERNGNWRRAGQVVNAIQAEGVWHLLAILPTDANESELYRVADQAESQLQLQPLPYELECQKGE